MAHGFYSAPIDLASRDTHNSIQWRRRAACPKCYRFPWAAWARIHRMANACSMRRWTAGSLRPDSPISLRGSATAEVGQLLVDAQPRRPDHSESYPALIPTTSIHVDRREDLFSLRSQRTDDALQLRSSIEESHRVDQEHWQGHHVGQRRTRRYRLRAVRAGAYLRYRDRQGTRVPIEIAADLTEVRPHFQNVARELRNAAISPTGMRAVFEAHGEVLTVPPRRARSAS